MKPVQIAAFRRKLAFTENQAAEHIGAAAGIEVSAAQWVSMELGVFPVPEQIVDVFTRLLRWRKAALTAANEQIALLYRQHGGHQRVALIEYASIEDWMGLPDRDPLLWRPQCLAVKELSKDRRVRTVLFDPQDYSVWLAGRIDGEDMRALWAAQAK